MKKSFLLFTIALSWCAPALHTAAYAHNEPSRVSVELESADHAQAGQVTIDFDLIDFKNKTTLKASDLAVMSEKVLHCFIWDPALKEFRHEHPTFDGSVWHVTTDLNVNGNYWVFFQGTIAADKDEFAASTRLNVSGGSPANPENPILGDQRSGSDGNSVATLSAQKIHAGKMVMLMLAFSRNDGTQPAITPFLGEMAHLTITTADGDSLIHVHPMSAPNNQLMVHTEFKEPGDYRVWVQFMDNGVLRTVPLSVTVLE